MATGYTHDVADGKVTDFSTFAARCAREFGALIMMRDDPMDAPIPDEFKPTDYHEKAIKEARAKQAALVAMTDPEKQSAFAAEMERRHLCYAEQRADHRQKRDRYESMLREVEAWEPPSKDHQGLKDFMREQLTSSIKHDCYEVEKPATPTLEEWWAGEVANAASDIGYYTKAHAEEVERVEGRNKWIRQLRESLAARKAVKS